MSATATPYVQSLTTDLLKVPKGVVFYDILALGYPASVLKPRLVSAKEKMIDYNHYDKSKFRTEQEIKDFIATLRSG